jgi:HEAT repeat protein
MRAQDLKDVPTPALFDRALVAGAVEPVMESEDYWAYIRALHFRPEKMVFEKAVALCSSSDWLSRSIGADILAQLGAGEGVAEYPFADDSASVLTSLLDDPHPLVTMSALHALGHLSRGEPARLVRLARHSSEDVRCALAYALGGRSDDVSLQTLIQLTTDDDEDTRDWATFGLGTLCEQDSPEIRGALAARLTDGNDEVRWEAMVGLAKRQDARAKEPILQQLREADVLKVAIEAAEEMPSPEFLPHLEQLHAAHPEDPGIQRALTRCRARASDTS